MPKSHPIVECVANVSEGRDEAHLSKLAKVISDVPGCYLLHRDSGADAHRTVFTFAGTPEGVLEAAYRLYAFANAHLDMRLHQGEHPRLGAVDVCPFVPLSGISEEDLKARTQVLASRVAQDFNLPVYLYEISATSPARSNLANLRRGEYEGLAAKLQDPAWPPDYGPRQPNPKLGATVMGVRPFLIAWNLNLAPDGSLAVARQLARKLRGSGYRGTPGLFPGLKAIGWRMDQYDRCQVSCNVVQPDKTDLARVYLTAVNLAASLGTSITGSELIGLIPEKYLRKAGKAFCFDDNRIEEMEAAVMVLGLDDLTPFNWRERVLEEVLQRTASA
jgi:glutamate formiminotransferase